MSAVTPTEVMVVDHLGQIEALEPSMREAAITAYLTQARDQLAHAVACSGPETVAALKAEIATAAEATRQLGLSKEIQADAQEMVRRAEYALGKAIRAGQEDGTIRRRGQGGGLPVPGVRGSVSRSLASNVIDPPPSATQFATHDELSGNGVGIYAMTDGVADAEFDAALADAKAEGNLSRANVVRKIQGVKVEGLTPVERLVKIRELAPTGRTSGQIAIEVGLVETTVRDIARRNNIEIVADRVMAGRRRGYDSNRIVQETVDALDGLTIGLRLIKLDDLDRSQTQNWAVSLTDSLRALNRLAKQIKEMTQ